jgi:hypothetical protein
MPTGRTEVETIPVRIASGASLSAEIDLTGKTVVGVTMPALWTASGGFISFQISDNAGDFNDFFDAAGNEETVAVVADDDKYHPLNPAEWEGIGSLKIRSGPTAGAVNQGANRDVILHCRVLRKKGIMARHQVETKQVTIANGASLSDAAHLKGLVLVGLTMPAAWTAAAAGVELSFQAQDDRGNWKDIFDAAGNEETVTVAANDNHYHSLDPKDWWGVSSIKVRSGLTGGAENQGGARVITLHGRVLA